MSRNPAGVGRAPPAIIVAYIEAIFEGCIGADHVSAMGVQDGFRFTSGTARIQDKEWIFRIHLLSFAFALRDRLLQQLVIPMVTPGLHVDFVTYAFHHDDILNG